MPTIGRKSAVVAVAALAAVSLLATRSACAQVAQGKTPEEATQYEIITKGLLANPILPIQFQSADLRLEIRNLIMGPGQAQAVPMPTRAIMELRGGGVVTTINREKRERRPGDFWVVEKGSALALDNRSDVVVIRAIYIFEGRK
ncbi:MAG: hypothetical protein ACRDFW_11450 [bacterium]